MRKNFGFDHFAAHVTGKCLGEDWSFQMEEAWKVFGDLVRHINQSEAIQGNAFVLMSNHFHFLCSSKNKNIKEVLEKFLKLLSGSFKNANLQNETYEISNFTHYLTVYKYIYRNPVDAGLVIRAEDYKYSSLHSLLGKRPHSLFIIDNMGLINHPGLILGWLNNSSENSRLFPNQPCD